MPYPANPPPRPLPLSRITLIDSMITSPPVRCPSWLIKPESPHADGTLKSSTFHFLYWSPNAKVTHPSLKMCLLEAWRVRLRPSQQSDPVSYTHLRAHETRHDL